MKNKKIIVQISEGLGNQLFMYAHSFSLSKRLNYVLEIDNISGFKKKKNLLRKHQQYLLDFFSLNSSVVKNDFLVNGKFYSIKKKLLLFLDLLKKKNLFILKLSIKVIILKKL